MHTVIYVFASCKNGNVLFMNKVIRSKESLVIRLKDSFFLLFVITKPLYIYLNIN